MEIMLFRPLLQVDVSFFILYLLYSYLIFLIFLNHFVLDTRFILLHKNQKSEEHIKQFFMDVNELYLKIEMNPFYQFNTPITSKVFRERVLQASQKRLGN